MQPFHSRSTLAATRLAAAYAVGVTLLISAFGLSVGGIRHMFGFLEVLAIPAGVWFGAAFVLLAIGRRLGFTALWLALLGFWIWITFGYKRAEMGFVIWSFIAAGIVDARRTMILVFGVARSDMRGCRR